MHTFAQQERTKHTCTCGKPMKKSDVFFGRDGGQQLPFDWVLWSRKENILSQIRPAWERERLARFQRLRLN